jgi:hypothetical protein
MTEQKFQSWMDNSYCSKALEKCCAISQDDTIPFTEVIIILLYLLFRPFWTSREKYYSVSLITFVTKLFKDVGHLFSYNQ